MVKISTCLTLGVLGLFQFGLCGSTPLGNSQLGSGTNSGDANGVQSPSGPGVHPGYKLVSFRNALDNNWRFGGIDWLSDGRMVAVRWGNDESYAGSGYYGDVQAAPNGQGPGAMYLISGTNGNSIAASNVTQIYNGLWEPLGVYVARRASANDQDTIYVITKTGLLRFVGTGPYTNGTNPVKVVNTCHARACRDSVGPGLYKSFTAYPPLNYDNSADTSGSGRRWHHFVAGLVRDSAGFLYTGTVSQYVDGNSVAQDQGRDRCSLLKMDPKNGTQQVIAGGLRSPSGLAIGPEGELFGTDIQGSYNPANKLVNYRPGRFYGMRCDPTNPYIGSVAESFPSVVFDQSAPAPYSNSNAPGEPLYLKHGIYAGQMLVGDVAFGGIQRVFLEKVNNEWQGAVFYFSGGFHAGIGRLKEDSTGAIYAASQAGGTAQASGNWCWGGAGGVGALNADKSPSCNTEYDFVKLVPKDTTVFELLAIRSKVNGFELQFTKKVGPSAAMASNYTLRTWTNTLSILSYGAGSYQGASNLSVSNVRIAPDSQRVFLQLASMPAASVRPSANPNTSSGSGNSRVVYFTGKNIRSAAGDVPWGTPVNPGDAPSVLTAWYTLNFISPDTAFSTPLTVDVKLASAEVRGSEFQLERQGSELVLNMPFAQPAQIVLRDLRGRIHFTADVPAGRSQQRIPLAGLSRGGYVAQARVGNKIFSRPFAVF